VKSLDILL